MLLPFVEERLLHGLWPQLEEVVSGDGVGGLWGSMDRRRALDAFFGAWRHLGERQQPHAST